MTLPNATLFPQALLPLYIFEPRYRQMLAEALQTHRMFAVAMQRPGNQREKPLTIAGLGMIRVSVNHRDGTSHLVLQGLARIELEETVRYKPYRVHRIRTLESPPCNMATADALTRKVRQLLEQRLQLDLPFPFPVMTPENYTSGSQPVPPALSAKEILGYLDSIKDPEQLADLVSCAVLPGAAERQKILETLDVETRLRRLIKFLQAELRDGGHASPQE